MSGNQKYKLPKGQGGQVLLEVLTAMVLLAFIALSIVGVCVQSSRWVSQARLHTQAGCLSFSLIEILRAGDAGNNWPEMAGRGWIQASDLGLAFLLPDNMNAFIYVQETVVSNHLYVVGIRTEWKWRNENHTLEMYSRLRCGQNEIY